MTVFNLWSHPYLKKERARYQIRQTCVKCQNLTIPLLKQNLTDIKYIKRPLPKSWNTIIKIELDRYQIHQASKCQNLGIP